MSAHEECYSGDDSHHMNQALTVIRLPLKALRSLVRGMEENPGAAGSPFAYGDNGEPWITATALPAEDVLAITLPTVHLDVREGKTDA
jgi:hypothetical protein